MNDDELRELASAAFRFWRITGRLTVALVTPPSRAGELGLVHAAAFTREGYRLDIPWWSTN